MYKFLKKNYKTYNECIKQDLNESSNITCLYTVRFYIVKISAFPKLIHDFSEICTTIPTRTEFDYVCRNKYSSIVRHS